MCNAVRFLSLHFRDQRSNRMQPLLAAGVIFMSRDFGTYTAGRKRGTERLGYTIAARGEADAFSMEVTVH